MRACEEGILRDTRSDPPREASRNVGERAIGQPQAGAIVGDVLGEWRGLPVHPVRVALRQPHIDGPDQRKTQGAVGSMNRVGKHKGIFVRVVCKVNVALGCKSNQAELTSGAQVKRDGHGNPRL